MHSASRHPTRRFVVAAPACSFAPAASASEPPRGQTRTAAVRAAEVALLARGRRDEREWCRRERARRGTTHREARVHARVLTRGGERRRIRSRVGTFSLDTCAASGSRSRPTFTTVARDQTRPFSTSAYECAPQRRACHRLVSRVSLSRRSLCSDQISDPDRPSKPNLGNAPASSACCSMVTRLISSRGHGARVREQRVQDGFPRRLRVERCFPRERSRRRHRTVHFRCPA